MTNPLYLAMTAEEYASCAEKPKHIAWMACHFSPYSTGITNLPPHLPMDAVVILNDRIPIDRHDPKVICKQLQNLGCSSLLLDFQRSDIAETKNLVSTVLSSLSCPVGVSAAYADGFNCPVFLPPIPPHIPPDEWLLPYRGREIWLEIGLSSSRICVDINGATITCCDLPENAVYPHHDDTLFCSYQIEIREKDIFFTLQREKEYIEKLLDTANKHGVTRAIGLYQELK